MPNPLALYDTAALRELERRAREVAGIDETTLMRRAGQAAWRCLLEHWPEARRVVVLCGPGNNGGDGWVLAKHALDSGVDIRVAQAAGCEPRTSLARTMAREYRDAGGRVEVFDGVLPDADVIVDALFGIGGDRAPEGEFARMIEAANASGTPILALDVPSGVNAQLGGVPGVSIIATRTLQFIAAHAGLATGAALDHASKLSLARLDLPAAVFDGVTAQAEVQPCPCFPRRPRDSHKGRFGHVLTIGGDHGSGGAIALSAEAALRCGAGLVSVATRAEHVAMLLARRPEAMVHAVDDADALRTLLDRADVLAIGPGLGQGAWGRALFDAAIGAGKPMVVDADALNLLAASPRALPNAVLTPHPGEAARLLDVEIRAVQADRFAAATQMSKRFECTVVLKGAGTIVVDAEQSLRVTDIGNPGMASGGMGDALTGVIATLLAQGFKALDAASAGAWLHARAGDRAALGGMAGMLASDLIAELRATIDECTP